MSKTKAFIYGKELANSVGIKKYDADGNWYGEFEKNSMGEVKREIVKYDEPMFVVEEEEDDDGTVSWFLWEVANVDTMRHWGIEGDGIINTYQAIGKELTALYPDGSNVMIEEVKELEEAIENGIVASPIGWINGHIDEDLMNLELLHSYEWEC